MGFSTGSKEIGEIKTAKFIADHLLALIDSLCDERRFDKAKEVLFGEMRDKDGDARLAAVVLYARTECRDENHAEAAEMLVAHYPLAEECRDDQLCAWFHVTLGGAYLLLKQLHNAEFEYTLASRHYALINDFDVVGCTENNLGFIAGLMGRGDEAREHFANARALLAGHPVKLAEVDDTEAQVNLLEGNWSEAAYLACKAHIVFKEHGEERLRRATLSTLTAAAASDAAHT